MLFYARNMYHERRLFLLFVFSFVFQSTLYTSVGLRGQTANTCYFNAALQALLACPPLTESIGTIADTSATTLPADSIIAHLNHLKVATWATDQFSHGYTTDRLIECMRIKSEHLRNLLTGEQQDVAEFIEPLLYTLSDEAKKYNPHFASLFEVTWQRAIRCSEIPSHSVEKLEKASLWALSLPSNLAIPLDVQMLLHDVVFAQEENNDPNTRCPVSERKSSLIEHKENFVWPAVLLLQLKRFDVDLVAQRMVKDKRVIDINRTLLIDDNTYNLYGVVAHRGGFGAGHYIAVVKHGTQWSLCDDTRIISLLDNQVEQFLTKGAMLVTLAEEPTKPYLVSAEPYVLFYVHAGWNQASFKEPKQITSAARVTKSKRKLTQLIYELTILSSEALMQLSLKGL